MKNLLSRLPLLLASIAMTLSAHADDWMSRLNDSIPVGSVSIPGSHDAATGDGFIEKCQCMENDLARFADLIAVTQDCAIGQQWASGIRAFDLRPDVMTDITGRKSLHIYHGLFATKRSFDSVLDQISDSLAIHPSEFAVIIMRHESDASRDSKDWGKLMGQSLARHADRLADFSPTLSVGQMRGRILLISRDGYEGRVYGTMASGWAHGTDLPVVTLKGAGGVVSMLLQDFYDTSLKDGLEAKKTAVRRLYECKLLSSQYPQWTINHTSGYALNMNHNGIEGISTSQGYRYNASTINNYLANLITDMPHDAGIVMMDFAATDDSDGWNVSGLRLTRAIIDSNFHQ